MHTDRFWQIIEQAKPGPAESADPDRLKEVLKRLPAQEVKDFLRQFYELLCDLNRWDIWGAGYVIAGGMGDDSFHYFRSWLIGKGREAVETALQNPDALGKFVIDDDEDVDNELLEYAALDVLEAQNIAEDPRDDCDRDSDADLEGTAFDEDAVYEQFPTLAKRFG